MGLLDTIQTGRHEAPPRVLLYGSEGVGKSTLGSQTPNPIFVPTEDGLGQIDCHRFPLAESYEDVLSALGALFTDKHDYQTVVIDSLDWLERLVWDAVCRDYGAKSIEKVDGGYGKGYIHSLPYWRKFLDGLNALHKERGMLVLLLAHAKVERFEDPESSAYDRYSPRLHKHAGALLTEWTDIVTFASRKFRVERESAGFNRERGIAHPVGQGGGERILRTVGGPSCVAKNRYDLPAELPLSWDALLGAIVGDSATAPA